MGGTIACAARLTDDNNTIVKFTMSTGYFHKTFNDPKNSLNEKNFIKKIKENDLYNRVTEENNLIFSEYGLVFIDFKNKKYFWMNDYSTLGVHDSMRFVGHLSKKIKNNDFNMTMRKDYIPETKTFKENYTYKVWDEPIGQYDAYCFLHNSLPFASAIKFNDKIIKNKKHIKELLPYFENDSGIYGDGSISDIIVVWDDWVGYNGFGDKNDLSILFDYLKIELLLSETIISQWNNYLKEID
jgi:hypothetical protein